MSMFSDADKGENSVNKFVTNIHGMPRHASDGDSLMATFEVNFDGPKDPEHPYNWSRSYKWSIVAVLSATSLITNIGTVMCSPAVPQILADFGVTGNDQGFYTTMIVTIWELGEACGPLLTAPLSELFGRRIVYNIANCLFIAFAIACAASSNVQMLIAFRFLNGLVVAAITLNPGIVADLFGVSERGRAMSIMNLPPLLGPSIAPIFSAYLTQAKSWQWTFWLTAIITGFCQIFVFLIYRETYKVQILRRKVKNLQKQGYVNATLPTAYKTGKGLVLWKSTIFRPFIILAQSPTVIALGLYVAVVYSYLFVVLTTTTDIYENIYGFTQGEAGLTFLGPGLGMLSGVILNYFISDWYVKLRAKSNGGITKPEYRLLPMIFGGILIPVGFFMFGWGAHFAVQWMLPIIGTAIIGFGLLVTNVPVFTYLVDAFGVHGASAMAAITVIKCIAGAFLPLAAPPLYARLGVGWGNSVFGFIALAFIPIPLLLLKLGERIRKSSKLQIID